ncbi:MAG: type III-B CRISPR-associated protein Cas10/Cmr2 [Leptothrix ochracea]|uniref:type III-B CRISPR-associated protein Cas10/Cmr2 n=1 Tax=Leptothrix ochracea TaxID=735331 RepID=UPI0034E1D5EA
MTDYTQKLAAWLHDPAEKALILLRDREGHEHGTVARLRAQLAIAAKAFDERADWLAAAADRPQWPRDSQKKYPTMEQVVFAREPELVHPLSGQRVRLDDLRSTLSTEQIKAASQAHFEALIVEGDARQTFLNFWRFGPELARLAPELGALWQIQPADTRVPDHTIWNHVDLVSAIHTALAGDANGPDQPALLAMSFGPVQGFIAQARSTSDLWAGSHLLSSLVWEALRSVVSRIGPDSVIFPALRGVPAVDRWLIEQDEFQGGTAGMRARFKAIKAEFLHFKDDTNPLFAASLPNKFVAIVPARQAQHLAEAAVTAVRQAVQTWAESAAKRVFDAAGLPCDNIVRDQIDAQLAGFPEAAWASAVWPVPTKECFRESSAVNTAAAQIKQALDTIHPDLQTQGVFAPTIWKTLNAQLQLDGVQFWSPSTGLLYAPVFELTDRMLAAAKAAKPFAALNQEGFRCSLTGEAEWLTHDRSLLSMNRKDREQFSVWGKTRGRFGIKRGEHLGAMATLKRLWPTLFAADVGAFLGTKMQRYVISTHALALSTSMEALIHAGLNEASLSRLERLVDEGDDTTTLPARLLVGLQPLSPDLRQRAATALKKLPVGMDSRREDTKPGADQRLAQFEYDLSELLGSRPETYYALIQMDGDRMGAWLAGNDDAYKLRYRDTWHSKVQVSSADLESRTPDLKRYLEAYRPSSPGRHMAISQALNDFSTHLARHVVEDCCKGKLLYAGGDDVLALVAVDDLFDCMQLLRLAYSGTAPHPSMGLTERVLSYDERKRDSPARLMLKDGFGYLRDRDRTSGRFMTLMGHKATASMGAVVAHHSAPLGMVLRELRTAEAAAKAAGRDRYCLRVLKRGGGEVAITAPWWSVADQDKKPQTGHSTLALMKRLAEMLAGTAFSRGAIYRAQLWFEGLTDGPATPAWREQLMGSLAWQFERQKGSAELAQAIVTHICDVLKPAKPLNAINDFLVTSEFFAREARSFRLAAVMRKKESA